MTTETELLRKIVDACNRSGVTQVPAGTHRPDLEELRALLNEARPLTPSGAGEGVKVKPLIWDAGAANPLGVVVWSSGDPWLFWIVKRPETNFVWCESLGFADSVPASPVRGSFDTLAEAKAAAQADYEARIRSALIPQEGGE